MGILHKRLLKQDIKLEVSDAALDLVADAGFDPVYGARPLKRSIQDLMENPLAQRLLAADFVGGDMIHVDIKDGALNFQKAIKH